MTAVDLHHRCPGCGAVGPVDLGDGNLLCLECRNEWSPDDPELQAAARVEAILGPENDGGLLEATATMDDDGGWARAERESLQELAEESPGPEVPPDDWTGLFVRDTLHPDRRVLLVVQDDGDRAIIVQDRHGVDSVVDRATVEYLGSDPDIVQEIVVDGSSDETAPLSGVILAVAGLVLEAGVECVGEGEDPELYQPRIGYLPPPCDGVPEVEQGVAYAVAILIRHFGLEKDLVRQLASGLLIGAEGAPESETER